jgi:hypothetical protein
MPAGWPRPRRRATRFPRVLTLISAPSKLGLDPDGRHAALLTDILVTGLRHLGQGRG